MTVYFVTNMLTGKLVKVFESSEDALELAGQMSRSGGCGFAQGIELTPPSEPKTES